MASMNVDQLIQSLIGGQMWHISDAVDIVTQNPFAGTMASIKIAAGILGFGVLCLQAFKIFIDGFQGQEALRRGITALMIAAIVMCFIQTPMYTLLLKTVIAAPAETIAGMVRDAYNEKFLEVTAKSWQAVGASKSEGFLAFTMNLGAQLVTTLLSAIIYVISTVLLIITPVIQKLLFKLMVIIGPICMVFALSDYTKSIAKQWLSLTLSIAWLGVFGAVAQYLSLTVHDSMVISVSDPLKTIIYGLVSIIIQISAFGLSAYVFGAVGSGLDRVANPVSAAQTISGAVGSTVGNIGGAGLATGAIAVGTGKVLQGMGSLAEKAAPQSGGIGDAIRGIAGGMKSAGDFVKSTGEYVGGKSDKVIQLSRGRMPKQTANTIQKEKSSVGGSGKKIENN
jgi:hypothetical protein